VPTTAAPQLLQPQHGARSRLCQTVSAQASAFRSGIAQQVSDIDMYYSGQYISKDCQDDGNKDHIEVLYDMDDAREEGQGDCIAKEVVESTTEEETDARIEREARQSMLAVMWMQAGYSFVDK
jgi:hypothetical protein